MPAAIEAETSARGPSTAQPLKARLLLMLGLARGVPPADLEQLFR